MTLDDWTLGIGVVETRELLVPAGELGDALELLRAAGWKVRKSLSEVDPPHRYRVWAERPTWRGLFGQLEGGDAA